MVFDDLRQAALDGLADFLPPRPNAALLTSRIHDIKGVNKTFPLDQMTPEQARGLLEAILGAEVVAVEAEAAGKLAARCAYNPLALEVAARRARQFAGTRKPIERYFELAQARFRELRMDGDARWDMERIFDISYDDLDKTGQQCFRAPAAFAPTGFAVEAAARLWQIEAEQARKTLSRFINLSLVKMVPGNLDRYRLHDLLDEYAALKLKASGEEAAARNALAEWIVALFDEHYTDDQTQAPEAAIERANLLRSCEWARGQKNAELLARLITKTRNWFFVSFTEDWLYWFAWLESAIQLGITDQGLKANVLKAIGDVQQFRKEIDAALTSYNEALKLFRQVGAKLGEANVLSSQGQMFLPENLEKANEFLNQAIQICQRIGSQYSIPAQIGNFGWKLYRLGEHDKAKPYLLQAAELFEKIGLLDYAERHRNAAQ